MTGSLPARNGAQQSASAESATANDAETLKADWHFAEADDRLHYKVEAWIDDDLAGRVFGRFQPEHSFVLEKIELSERHRCKGHGTRLIQKLRSKARAHRCNRFVIKGVRLANSRAIKLYKSLGGVATTPADGLCDFIISPP